MSPEYLYIYFFVRKNLLGFNGDMAAKRHKNEILHLIISIGYEIEIRKF